MKNTEETRDLNTIVSEFIGYTIGFVIGAFIMSWFVQNLWNSVLIPAVDGLHPIGYWQAMGIYVLADLLFKNKPVKL